MKRIALFITLFFFLLNNTFIKAQTNNEHIWVNGYVKKDGSYVRGHYKTKANGTVNDNFSTIGNVNPYTGKSGWLPRDIKESEQTHDDYYDRKIPTDYIFRSRNECQLAVINVLNLFTIGLDKQVSTKIDRPNWAILNDTLYTRLEMSVWEADEEYFARLFLAYYFSEIETISERTGIYKLLKDLGLKTIVVNTPNDDRILSLDSIEKTNLDD